MHNLRYQGACAKACFNVLLVVSLLSTCTATCSGNSTEAIRHQVNMPDITYRGARDGPQMYRYAGLTDWGVPFYSRNNAASGRPRYIYCVGNFCYLAPDRPFIRIWDEYAMKWRNGNFFAITWAFHWINSGSYPVTGHASQRPTITEYTTCECPSAFEISATGCTSCPSGKYKISISDAQCDQCPSNIRMLNSVLCALCDGHSYKKTSTAVSYCLRCPFGTYPETAGAGTFCAVCPAGTYAREPGPNTPETCVLCPAGTYSNVLGATGSATCLNCPVGSSSLGGATNINNCTCTAGFTGSGGADCTACPPGTWKPLPGGDV